MTEALKIIEAERQKLKAALEEIGKMSLHDKSGQAVVVARKAIEGLEVWACFNTFDSVPHEEQCVFDVPDAEYCSLAKNLKTKGKSKTECKYWRKVTTGGEAKS